MSFPSTHTLGNVARDGFSFLSFRYYCHYYSELPNTNSMYYDKVTNKLWTSVELPAVKLPLETFNSTFPGFHVNGVLPLMQH